MPKHQFDVSVTPQYMPEDSAPEAGVYHFAYTITIRNSGATAAQLIARHWIIKDASGTLQEVRGLGVVGHQPLLKPGERFEYTSWTRLDTPHGVMQGTYFCMTDAAEAFEAPIPAFTLARQQSLH